jgi:hypothetical protein
MTKDELLENIKIAQKQLDEANAKFVEFETSIENNVFASLNEAESTLERLLEYRARAACEGSYNCGLDQYTQKFIVDNIIYIAILDVEYNRHDKTYYYIDQSDFHIEKLTEDLS